MMRSRPDQILRVRCLYTWKTNAAGKPSQMQRERRTAALFEQDKDTPSQIRPTMEENDRFMSNEDDMRVSQSKIIGK